MVIEINIIIIIATSEDIILNVNQINRMDSHHYNIHIFLNFDIIIGFNYWIEIN